MGSEVGHCSFVRCGGVTLSELDMRGALKFSGSILLEMGTGGKCTGSCLSTRLIIPRLEPNSTAVVYNVCQQIRIQSKPTARVPTEWLVETTPIFSK